MAAKQTSKLLHSKLSATSLRHLAYFRHHSTAVFTAAATATISLAGKPPFFAAIKPKLAENVADLRLNGRVDWPAAFDHQQFAEAIEAAAKKRRNDDDDDEHDHDHDHDDDFDDDDDDYDEDILDYGSSSSDDSD